MPYPLELSSSPESLSPLPLTTSSENLSGKGNAWTLDSLSKEMARNSEKTNRASVNNHWQRTLWLKEVLVCVDEYEFREDHW